MRHPPIRLSSSRRQEGATTRSAVRRDSAGRKAGVPGSGEERLGFPAEPKGGGAVAEHLAGLRRREVGGRTGRFRDHLLEHLIRLLRPPLARAKEREARPTVGVLRKRPDLLAERLLGFSALPRPREDVPSQPAFVLKRTAFVLARDVSQPLKSFPGRRQISGPLLD